MAANWYIASFRHQQIALVHLQLQGFGSWIPTEPVDIYVHGHVRRLNKPLFGKYLLVNFDIDIDPWHRVNNTPGIKRLLPINDRNPLPVPADFVELLMEREAKDLLTPREFLDLARGYAPGDWVDVKRGIYGGQGGHFLRADYRKGLIIVLLRLCNRPQNIQISPHCVDRKSLVLIAPQRKSQ